MVIELRLRRQFCGVGMTLLTLDVNDKHVIATLIAMQVRKCAGMHGLAARVNKSDESQKSLAAQVDSPPCGVGAR